MIGILLHIYWDFFLTHISITIEELLDSRLGKECDLIEQPNSKVMIAALATLLRISHSCLLLKIFQSDWEFFTQGAGSENLSFRVRIIQSD